MVDRRPIAELEGHGLEVRVINALEQDGLLYIDQLADLEKPIHIDGLSGVGLMQLMRSLARLIADRRPYYEHDLQEISSRAGTIRDSWSDEEADRRAINSQKPPVHIRELKVEDIFARRPSVSRDPTG